MEQKHTRRESDDPEGMGIFTPGTEKKRRKEEEEAKEVLMKQGRRGGEVDVTYVQKEGRARYVYSSDDDGWRRCILSLLWVFTFLCGLLVGILVGAGACSDLDSQGWGQWNPIQAALSMWRSCTTHNCFWHCRHC